MLYKSLRLYLQALSSIPIFFFNLLGTNRVPVCRSGALNSRRSVNASVKAPAIGDRCGRLGGGQVTERHGGPH